MIKNIDNFDFFSELGPKSRLANLIKCLEPSFARSVESKMPKLIQLY